MIDIKLHNESDDTKLVLKKISVEYKHGFLLKNKIGRYVTTVVLENKIGYKIELPVNNDITEKILNLVKSQFNENSQELIEQIKHDINLI